MPNTGVLEKCAETWGKTRTMPWVMRSTTVLPDGVMVPNMQLRDANWLAAVVAPVMAGFFL